MSRWSRDDDRETTKGSTQTREAEARLRERVRNLPGQSLTLPRRGEERERVSSAIVNTRLMAPRRAPSPQSAPFASSCRRTLSRDGTPRTPRMATGGTSLTKACSCERR